MRRILLFGLVSLAAAQIEGNASQEVKKVEAERVNAMLKQDWVTLERIYADDYLSFDSRSGQVRNKSKVIADLKSGDRKLVSVDDQEVTIRMFENTAVITGLSHSKVVTRGQTDSGSGRYIQVYVKRRWQMVAHQFTPFVQ